MMSFQRSDGLGMISKKDTEWKQLRSGVTHARCSHVTCALGRAGIVQISDLEFDTVPGRYFFQYQFYEISFNKITFSKMLVLFFELVDIYTASSSEPLHKGTNYIQHNQSVQIVFSLYIC